MGCFCCQILTRFHKLILGGEGDKPIFFSIGRHEPRVESHSFVKSTSDQTINYYLMVITRRLAHTLVLTLLFSCRYCAGTMPWGNPGDHHDFEPQRHDDGYIEVSGFTMASLVSNTSVLLK